MPSEKEIYEKHAAEYEALVSHEDHQGNILRSIKQILPLDGLDVLDQGAGTGRLACLLAPFVKSMLACDLSQNMLGITHEKLNNLSPGMASPTACLAAVADHRFLPLKDGCIDLIVSGWSVSYLTVWYPDHWHLGADRWLIEAKRVLRKRGTIILFESLGTGNKSPQPLDHLKNFYNWLDENEFKKKWIRTDYQFESPEEAADISGFFFGNDMKTRILRERIKTLPECTGMWWMKI